MATVLTLFQNVLRKLTTAEVDQNFVNTAATADAAKAVTDTVAVGGGANTIPKLDGSGNLRVGTGSGTCHAIVKAGASATTEAIVLGNAVAVYNADYDIYSAASAVAAPIRVGISTNNVGRSLGCAGTGNFSGADYAEYELKASDCGEVVPGQIIGFDENGHVVDRWSKAISFGIKSTKPSVVGGDTWGSEDVVGKRPEAPLKGEHEPEDNYLLRIAADTDYQQLISVFETKLEAARQKVDRIAYSGKVPCNVAGAGIGDFIIAVPGPDGSIMGVPVKDPSFDEYRKAVGRVRRILEDGRPEVAVIVH